MSKKIMTSVIAGVVMLAMGLTGCGGQKAAQENKATVIKVGTDAAFAPFEFQDEKSKEYVGFDIDLIKAIGKQMGAEVQVQSINFDGLIPALDSGNIDAAISGMTITEERLQKVAFSTPYYKSGLTIVTKSDNTAITGFKDLEGKRIAVQIGTTGAEEARKIKNAQVREFNVVPESFMELQAGGVDAVINDRPVNDYYMKESGKKNAKQVGEPLTAEDYGIAIAKKNTQLVEKINKALDELKKNGEYDKIHEKWFGKKG